MRSMLRKAQVEPVRSLYTRMRRDFMATDRKPAERARRARIIRAARTTSELEGARSTAATRADQDAYVRGEIDIAQLGERVRARYKLTNRDQ